MPATSLIKEAKKALLGKSTRLDDEELEYLAQEITKLGFKLGFARAYAQGPSIMEKMIRELERQDKQLEQIKKSLNNLLTSPVLTPLFKWERFSCETTDTKSQSFHHRGNSTRTILNTRNSSVMQPGDGQGDGQFQGFWLYRNAQTG